MDKLRTISLAINGILILAITILLSSISHPFEDPKELMRALQLGWGIRGIQQQGIVDTTEFQTKCVLGQDYDTCRESIGHMVNAVRAKYRYPSLPQPHAQSSAPIEQQRP